MIQVGPGLFIDKSQIRSKSRTGPKSVIYRLKGGVRGNCVQTKGVRLIWTGEK